MVYLLNAIGVVVCGFLLSLGLSTVAQAEMFDRMQGGQGTSEKQMQKMEGNQSTDGKIIRGEVLRVEGNDYFLKSQDGKEVRLHIDVTTLKATNIGPGEHIEAQVDEQNHVLSIFSVDRRNDKG